jgi:hypothetical protein
MCKRDKILLTQVVESEGRKEKEILIMGVRDKSKLIRGSYTAHLMELNTNI